MTDGIEIKGGAGEFEAAVIAVVLDQIARDETEARQGRTGSDGSGLSAWVRALLAEQPGVPREITWPDH